MKFTIAVTEMPRGAERKDIAHALELAPEKVTAVAIEHWMATRLDELLDQAMYDRKEAEAEARVEKRMNRS